MISFVFLGDKEGLLGCRFFMNNRDGIFQEPFFPDLQTNGDKAVCQH